MSRTPTAFEQSILEYVNQARMNPGGEYYVTVGAGGAGVQSNIANAVSYFGVDLAAFRAQMAEYSAVAPLAWSGALGLAAQRHSQLMIDADTQSHRLPGESGLGTRITDAGYTSWRTVGENI